MTKPTLEDIGVSITKVHDRMLDAAAEISSTILELRDNIGLIRADTNASPADESRRRAYIDTIKHLIPIFNTIRDVLDEYENSYHISYNHPKKQLYSEAFGFINRKDWWDYHADDKH